MRIIKKMAEQICDEVDGVLEYAKDALEYKKTRPDLAETYHRIAIQEIQHADLLHAKIVQIVQEAESMNGGDYVVEMKDKWEELHRDIVSKMAKAKMYNSLYSK